MKKFLDILMFGVFFLYPILFIGMDNRYFIKVLNATRFVESVILPVFIVWLALNWRRYEVRVPLTFLAPFVPIIIAAAILSVYHHRSIEMNILPKLVVFCLASGALVAVYKKRVFYIINSFFCWGALCWMASLVIRDGISLYLNNFHHLVNQNEVYMMVVLMSGVSIFASQEVKGKEQFFHLLSGLAGLGCVVLTQARGALVDILVLFFVFFFSSNLSLKCKLKVLLACLLMCAMLVYLTDGFNGRLGLILSEITLWFDGKGQATSIGTRLSLWYAGIVDIFPHFPLMGTGVREGHLGDLAQLVSLTERPGWTIGMQPHFHNDFVQMAVKGGILYVGAGIASLILITLQYRSHSIVIWLIACAIASGLTEHFYFQPRVFIFFVMIFTLVVTGIYKERREKLLSAQSPGDLTL